jgi:hypothetical protein
MSVTPVTHEPSAKEPLGQSAVWQGDWQWRAQFIAAPAPPA